MVEAAKIAAQGCTHQPAAATAKAAVAAATLAQQTCRSAVLPQTKDEPAQVQQLQQQQQQQQH